MFAGGFVASNNISYYVGIAVTYILGMIMPWRVAAALSIGIALAKHKNRKNWNKNLYSLFENYALGICSKQKYFLLPQNVLT